MTMNEAFTLMPFTVTFALMLTFSMVVCLPLALAEERIGKATASGEPWGLTAQLSTRLRVGFALALGAIGFVGTIVAALFESM